MLPAMYRTQHDMGLFNDPYSHFGPKESDPVDTNAESRLHRKEARKWRAKAWCC